MNIDKNLDKQNVIPKTTSKLTSHIQRNDILNNSNTIQLNRPRVHTESKSLNHLSPMSKEKQTEIQKQLESQKQWIDEHDSESQLRILSTKYSTKGARTDHKTNAKLQAFQRKCQQFYNCHNNMMSYHLNEEKQLEKRIYLLAKEIKDLNQQKEILSSSKCYENQSFYNPKTFKTPQYFQQVNVAHKSRVQQVRTILFLTGLYRLNARAVYLS